MRKPAILATVFVLALCTFAQDDDTKPKATSKERDQCNLYVAGGPAHDAREVNMRAACFAYARGVRDEMDGELNWSDDTRKKVVIGHWQDGVTVDQIIRVFLDYVGKNPAQLNKPVRDVIRQSAEQAGIYTYETP